MTNIDINNIKLTQYSHGAGSPRRADQQGRLSQPDDLGYFHVRGRARHAVRRAGDARFRRPHPSPRTQAVQQARRHLRFRAVARVFLFPADTFGGVRALHG